MNKGLILLMVLTATLSPVWGQQAAIGSWGGEISAGDTKLPLQIHVSEKEGSASAIQAVFDSPSQGAFGIAFSTAEIKEDSILLTLNSIKVLFKGKFIHQDTLQAIWIQSGISLPITLARLQKTVEPPKRYQEPKPKFPYHIGYHQFYNPKTGITHGGTLTMPKGKGPFPAVVLVNGSGQQNRDSEIMGHKPFWVIADYLTKNNIAVFRYDDRGIGESGGDFDTSTTYDFADDAEAALAFLLKQPKINQSATGIIGHSEGAMIGAVVAARNPKVNFFISLAGPGIPIKQLMITQLRATLNLESNLDSTTIENTLQFSVAFFDFLTKHHHSREQVLDSFPAFYDAYLAQYPESDDSPSAGLDQFIDQALSKWFLTFIRFTPRTYLSQIKVPILALNGEKDMQVDATENLHGIAHAWSAENSKLTIRRYSELNHLFQTATTGAPSEYAIIEETFSPEVLEDMKAWILIQSKK